MASSTLAASRVALPLSRSVATPTNGFAIGHGARCWTPGPARSRRCVQAALSAGTDRRKVGAATSGNLPAEQLLKGLEAAAKGGAQVVMAAVDKPRTIDYKGATDLVTDTDRKTELAILKTLRDYFPDHLVLGEEGGVTGDSSSEYLWCVDPLDGTTNFAHSYPSFGVSIAVLHRGRPAAAAVVEFGGGPFSWISRTFTASAGGGAFCNGNRIHVSKTDKVEKSLLVTGFGYEHDEAWSTNLALFKEFTDISRGVRRLGAASVDMCHVALGIVDAYWEYRLKPWDMAAGVLIVEEAGGVVTRMDGGEFTVFDRSVLVSNGLLHDKMLEKIKPPTDKLISDGFDFSPWCKPSGYAIGMASLSAPRLFRKLHASCPQSPGVDNIGRFVKPCFTAPYPLRLLAAKVRTDIGGRPRPWAWPPACSSSAAAGVEEDEILETKTEDTTVDGRPVRTLSQEAFVKEAVRRLSEEELEVAVRKYNLEEELFAEVDYAQVNAFTDRPFSGNPAAVCYLPYAKDDTWLQVIAREFTLPATAFIVKREQKAGMEEDAEGEEEGEDEGELKREQVDFDLRWFSPKQELDLCGHATLASAHLLFAAGIVEGNVICFHTRAGVLQARKVRGYDQEATPEEEDAPAAQKKKPSGKGVVEIDLPIITAQECSSEQAQGLKEALGVRDVVWSGVTSPGNFLVELPSSEDVVAVKPRLHILENLPGLGVIVTARAGASGQHHQDVDFVSRYFAPKKGIPEDPVTGSAHCVLGWYWKSKLGKSRLEAYQASERGGRISLRVDEESGRVYMEGGAVLVMAGVILNSLRALDKQKS